MYYISRIREKRKRDKKVRKLLTLLLVAIVLTCKYLISQL